MNKHSWSWGIVLMLAILGSFPGSTEAKLKIRRSAFRRFPNYFFRNPTRFYFDGRQFSRRQFPTVNYKSIPWYGYGSPLPSHNAHFTPAPQVNTHTHEPASENNRPVATPQESTSSQDSQVAQPENQKGTSSSNSDQSTLEALQGKWNIECFSYPNVSNFAKVEMIITGNSMTIIGRIFSDSACTKPEATAAAVETFTFSIGKDSNAVSGAKEINVVGSDGKVGYSTLKLDRNLLYVSTGKGAGGKTPETRDSDLSPTPFIKQK